MPTKEETPTIRMELKYCERCGGLWLRPAGSGLNYCESCAAQMAELPTVRLKTAVAGDAGDGEEGRRP